MNRSALYALAGAAALLVTGLIFFAAESPFTDASPAAVSTSRTSSEGFASSTTDPGAAQSGVVRLAVAGDVGTGEDEELRTAAAVDTLEADDEYDALLLLGDNVYPDGDPSELRHTVFEPFDAVLDGGTALLPVLGNHDVRDGYGDEQVSAFGLPGRWYSTLIGNVLIVALDSNDPNNPAQLSWLEETLAASDAEWKIAMMHHPPYSGGEHGSSFDVREAFSPIFERHGVQLVLAGHDHDYQRSESIGGVVYIVSGGAAKLRDTGEEDFTVMARSVFHFLDITIDDDQMAVLAVDQAGTTFDSLVLRPAS